MQLDDARVWITTASLCVVAVTGGFFILAPAAGFPLAYPQALGMLKLIFPIFLGYLGSATYFLFKEKKKDKSVQKEPERTPLLQLLLKGPIYTFLFLFLIIITSFYLSNRPTSPPESGMDVDDLSSSIALLLGLLAVTTNVIVSYLFSVEDKSHEVQSAQ